MQTVRMETRIYQEFIDRYRKQNLQKKLVIVFGLEDKGNRGIRDDFEFLATPWTVVPFTRIRKIKKGVKIGEFCLTVIFLLFSMVFYSLFALCWWGNKKGGRQTLTNPSRPGYISYVTCLDWNHLITLVSRQVTFVYMRYLWILIFSIMFGYIKIQIYCGLNKL